MSRAPASSASRKLERFPLSTHPLADLLHLSDLPDRESQVIGREMEPDFETPVFVGIISSETIALCPMRLSIDAQPGDEIVFG